MTEILTYSALLAASTLGGAAVVHIWGKKLVKQLSLLLAFGGSYLIGLIFLHLVPEVFHLGHAHESANTLSPGWFILAGFVLQIFLEYFSNGIEHGHSHLHDHGHSHDHSEKGHHHGPSTKTRAFPLAAFLSLCVHGFIEAMPLAGGAHAHHHHHHGDMHIDLDSSSLMIGLMIHTFPVAMVLAALLLATRLSKGWQWFYIAIFALVPLAGMLLSDVLLHHSGLDANLLLSALGGMLIGILLHIATTMLFETSDGHHFNLRKLLIIVVGLGLAAVTLA
jgi:hypothetical protein